MFQLTTRLRVAARTPLTRPTSSSTTIQRSSLTPRLFSTQTRLLIREDADRSPDELEKTKQDQIKKQERGEGHWHEELASAGEANIAADKENVDDHGDHMEQLQKETAGKVEKEHPHGKA